MRIQEGEKLWNKYCSFFDKPFSEQVEYNNNQMQKYFEKWKKTKMAKKLCPEGAKKFEDVPLTTYEDYPILREFGAKVEYFSKTIPRKKGELWWDYYSRISKKVAPILNEWMVDNYHFCLKTSGGGGESKWFAYGDTYWKNCFTALIAAAIFACSDDFGKTKIKKGDRILNVLAPPPYGSAVAIKVWETVFKCVPPTRVIENITSMRKKNTLILKTIKKEKIDFLAGVPSVVYALSQNLTCPEKFYKDRYQSMGPGIGKFILFLKYLLSKVGRKEYRKAKEAMPLKGLLLGGFDGTLYLDYLRDQFDVEPFNLYALSDANLPMMGRPHRKFDLFPNLMGNYLEFLTNDGKIKKIDELKKNQPYELVTTVFGMLPVRYLPGDILRVIDFQDDGMPIFSFEGRKVGMIDIYGYFRLSESMIRDALKKVGLSATDNWAVTKEIHPMEHVCFLMEKEWDYSQEKATKLIFESLQEVNPDFRNYVKDFRIKKPREVIKIEYLKKGAFTRYTMKRMKEGVPLGQVKPPKIINFENRELAELLRRV